MNIYLLPPSEGKNTGGIDAMFSRTFNFSLPLEIASHATQKDLKCTGARYEEGMRLNRGLQTPTPEGTPSPYQGTLSDGGGGEFLPAIQRYSGVMYKAIGFDTMSELGKKAFDEQVMILSGMYGLLTPQDMTANYKLPIDTKGLRAWRGEKVTDGLLAYVGAFTNVVLIDLLSGAYKKMLDPKKIREAGVGYVEVKFLKQDGSPYTHGVKKVKGEWLRGVCEGNKLDVQGDVLEIVV